jgi:putative Holliday junction resolvase
MAESGTRPGVRLAVDVGSVRVGIAMSDREGVLATPVTNLRRDRKDDSDLDALVGLAADHEAALIVVGMPLTLRGAEGAAAATARDYALKLAERVAPVPVHLVDERFSTVTATHALRSGGVTGRRQRSVVDQASAVVVLQAVLDAERASGTTPGELITIDEPGRS